MCGPTVQPYTRMDKGIQYGAALRRRNTYTFIAHLEHLIAH